MVKLTSYALNVGYPVYGARFVNNNTVIIAGGGGDGNNGIPNKMTAVLIQPENTQKPLKRYRELLLNDNEDCVMSLDVGNGTIIAGINENPLMMAKGVNKHLRKFKFENDHLKFVESCQIHPNASSTIYQKITAISHDGSVGVIVMSDTPSSVYIVETSSDMEEKFKIVTEGDVKDVTISQDGKLMCYITSTVFEVISLVTGRSVYKTKVDFLMSKVRFLDNNDIIIAGSKNKAAFVAKFSISASKITQQKVVYKNMKGITSMDVNPKNGLIALATSSYSLILINSSDFRVLKVLNKVHEFAITKAVFSEDGKYLASTSAANTICVVEIPKNFSASKSLLATIFQYIFSIVLIAALAMGAQFLYENGYVDVAMNKALELYDSYKPQDSSSYFTVESIESFKSPKTESSYSRPHSTVDEHSVPSSTLHTDESLPIETSLASSFNPADLTINGDIISEVTTSVGYTVSTDSFLDDVVPETSVETTETTETTSEINNAPSEMATESTTGSSRSALVSSSHADITSVNSPTADILTSVDAESTSVSEPTSFSDASSSNMATGVSLSSEGISSLHDLTSSTILSVPVTEKEVKADTTVESTSISEVTKEITKEVTSFIVSTETEVATSYLTSLKVVTSIQTSISTEVSISTSVQVETVYKEITLTKESSMMTTSVTATPSSTEDYGIQIEPEKKVYENPYDALEEQEQIILDEILAEKPALDDDSSVDIQIEPSKEVYMDPSDSVKGAAKMAIEELKQKASEIADDKFGIQIEPSKEVYSDSDEGSKAEAEKAQSDLEGVGVGVTGDIGIQIEPEIVTFTNGADAASFEGSRIAQQLTGQGKTTDKIVGTGDAMTSEESHHTDLTPNVRSETEHEYQLDKDEL